MIEGICKVCDILDNDISVKKVKYCHFCVAFICTKCYPNMWRRAKAMFKQKK